MATLPSIIQVLTQKVSFLVPTAYFKRQECSILVPQCVLEGGQREALMVWFLGLVAPAQPALPWVLFLHSGHGKVQYDALTPMAELQKTGSYGLSERLWRYIACTPTTTG